MKTTHEQMTKKGFTFKVVDCEWIYVKNQYHDYRDYDNINSTEILALFSEKEAINCVNKLYTVEKETLKKVPHIFIWGPSKYKEINSILGWIWVNFVGYPQTIGGDVYVCAEDTVIPPDCRKVKEFRQAFKANSLHIRHIKFV